MRSGSQVNHEVILRKSAITGILYANELSSLRHSQGLQPGIFVGAFSDAPPFGKPYSGVSFHGKSLSAEDAAQEDPIG